MERWNRGRRVFKPVGLFWFMGAWGSRCYSKGVAPRKAPGTGSFRLGGLRPMGPPSRACCFSGQGRGDGCVQGRCRVGVGPAATTGPTRATVLTAGLTRCSPAALRRALTTGCKAAPMGGSGTAPPCPAWGRALTVGGPPSHPAARQRRCKVAARHRRARHGGCAITVSGPTLATGCKAAPMGGSGTAPPCPAWGRALTVGRGHRIGGGRWHGRTGRVHW